MVQTASRNGSRSNGARTGLTPEAFVLKAIQVLRKDNKPSKKDGSISKGIHVVYSGFNAAFREQFPDVDGRSITNKMAAAGTIAVMPCFGGAMIYLAGDAPERQSSEARAQATLSKILGS